MSAQALLFFTDCWVTNLAAKVKGNAMASNVSKALSCLTMEVHSAATTLQSVC